MNRVIRDVFPTARNDTESMCSVNDIYWQRKGKDMRQVLLTPTDYHPLHMGTNIGNVWQVSGLVQVIATQGTNYWMQG